MRLVDHDDRVSREEGVHEGFSDEEAIGQEFDAGGGRRDVLEADGISNFFSKLTTNLLCDPGCHRGRGNTSGLSVVSVDLSPAMTPRAKSADGFSYLCDSYGLSIGAPPCLFQVLGDLRTLSRPSLANNDGDWICLDCVEKRSPVFGNG